MKAKKENLVVLTGGGTGGHIFPLLAVAEELIKKDRDLKLIYFGSGLALERKLAKQNHLDYQPIICGKFRRFYNLSSIFLNIADLFRLKIGIIQAFFLLLHHRPTLIFSKGGYVCLPTVLAAALLRIPIVSHESDVLPGLANRFVLSFIRRVAVSFPQIAHGEQIKKKAVYTGLPLRKEFDLMWQKEPQKGKYLLVIGGSSGAVSLNSMIFDIAKKILPQMPIVHLTGDYDYERAKEFLNGLPDNLRQRYQIMPFSKTIADLIDRAEVVVSRAGATAIFELAACRKKAIFVPIDQSVTRHQLVNALYLQKNDLAQVVLSHHQTDSLLQKIMALFKSADPPTLGNLYFPSSAEFIAQIVLDEVKKDELKNIHRFFFIGILGVSMKGLAKVLRGMGKNVIGSDLKLEGHRASHITADLDLVVYSSAASYDSEARVEHEQAKKLDIPVIKRSQMIGWLMKGKEGISVSGMHGKTTISSLIARILDRGGLEPSYLIGAEETPEGKTAKISSGKYFVAEACEYDGSFLDFPTTIAIISNIEEEHLDYFKKGLPEIKEKFLDFIKRIYPGGYVIYSADDLNIFEVLAHGAKILKQKKITLISYGFKPTADYSIKNYKVEDNKLKFTIEVEKKKFDFESNLSGKHFALNSAASFAAARIAGVDDKIVKETINSYRGAFRRFYLMGKREGLTIYDDYAHHPTELEATLNSLAELYPKERKIIIFQPHQQSRFNRFFPKFVKILSSGKVDIIGILPVYYVAGRDEEEKYSAQDLVGKISQTKPHSYYLNDYERAYQFVSQTAQKGDIIMTIGATDVYKIAYKLLENKK